MENKKNLGFSFDISKINIENIAMSPIWKFPQKYSTN